MGDVFVLVRTPSGELRDITLEMLTKASGIAEEELGGKRVAVLIGSGVDSFAEKLPVTVTRFFMSMILFFRLQLRKISESAG